MNIVPSFFKKRYAHRPNLITITDQILWIIFDRIFRLGSSLFVNLWVARYLGPDQFGSLNYVLALTSMTGAIASFGIESLLMPELIKTPDKESQLFDTVATIWIVGGILSYLVSAAIVYASSNRESEFFQLTLLVALPNLFIFMNVALHGFAAKLQTKYAIWIQNAVFFVFVGAKIYLILMRASLPFFALLTGLEVVMTALITFLAYQRVYPRKWNYQFSKARAVELVRRGFPLLLGGISVSIFMRIDQIMINHMSGVHEVGIYSAAIRISEVWYFIPHAIVTSLLPAILKAKNENSELYLARLTSLYSFIFILSFGVALIITLISPYLVDILYGKDYSGAATILAIHVWGGVIAFLGVINVQFYIIENMQSAIFQRTLVSVLINIGLNYILLPIYGAIGAAFATVVGQFFGVILMDLFDHRTRRLFYLRLHALNPLNAKSIFSLTS